MYAQLPYRIVPLSSDCLSMRLTCKNGRHTQLQCISRVYAKRQQQANLKSHTCGAHSQGVDDPHSQMLNRIGRPVALSALRMASYRS